VEIGRESSLAKVNPFCILDLYVLSLLILAFDFWMRDDLSFYIPKLNESSTDEFTIRLNDFLVAVISISIIFSTLRN